ncbi:DUF4129 domain-containing protein [Deinococcus budaensis]|uniref:Protein-glutamine gamma-glutamyltransferase-like C-terminal domain-containing protein n=1 Tax=Deinococcus budaensis TaxID=1665626 RepID=A0A7W8LRD1_9DEIO|nr:hypothetical protein [Deinococcus budaensis]
MTPASPTPTRRPWRPDRSWLLLAAPLVAVSWLPWWAVLGLLVALTLTHHEGEARLVRVPLLLLGGGLGLALLLPDLRGAGGAVIFVWTFARVIAGTLLVYWSVSLLEGGNRRWGAAGLAALLLPGALLPGALSPLGLAAGVLALVLTLLGAVGRENSPARRLGGGGRAGLAVTGAAAAVGALLGLAALSWAAPAPAAGVASAPAAPAAQQDRPPGTDPGGREGESAGAGRGERPRPSAPAPPGDLRDVLPGSEYSLLGAALLIGALLFTTWRLRERGARGRRAVRWWEVAAVLGLGLTAVLLLLFGLAVRSGAGAAGGPGGGVAVGAGGPLVPAASPAVSALPPLWRGTLTALNLLALAFFTLLALGVLWTGLRARRAAAQAGVLAPGLLPAEPPGALHRVRLAYRAAQGSLAAAGLGRAFSETPAEHAARAALTRPDLAPALDTLVAAYAPVRYGGRVTDEDAEKAEAAAREIGRLGAGRPPAPPPSFPESETP